MSHQKTLLLYTCFQVLLLVLFYFRFICGAKSFYFEDITQFFEPLCCYIGSEVSRAHIPLWNPYQYCGMPQIAISSPNIFYPPNLLFAITSFNSGLAINMIFHQLLCGIGGFLMIFEFGWGALAGAVCGLILALSGYMFSASSNYTLAATAAWCPLTFWSFLRIGSDAKNVWKWTTISSVFVCMLLSAGRPELALPQLTLLASLILYTKLTEPPLATTSGDTWVWQLRALTIGATLSMPSLLPAMEWLGLSRRSNGLLDAEVFMFSSNWYDMLCLLTSQPLGDLQLRYASLRSVAMRGDLVPYISSAFVGPVAFALALLGIFDKRWKFRLLILILLLLTVVLCLGSNTPVMPAVLKLLPALSIIRFPVKLMFFLVWCLAIMAARGIHAIQNNNAPILKGAGFWALVSIIGATLAAYHNNDILCAFGDSSTQGFGLHATHPEQNIGIGILCSGAVATAITLMCSWKNQRVASAIIAVALPFGLLAHAWTYTNQSTKENFFGQSSKTADMVASINEPARQLQLHRVTSLYLEHFTLPDEVRYTDRNAATAAAYQYSRQVLRPNTNIDFRIRSASGFECTPIGDYYYLFLNAYAKSSQSLGAAKTHSDVSLARFCQLTATRYAITQIFRQMESLPPAPVAMLDVRLFQPIFDDRNLNIRLYQITSDLPRAYFSTSWQWSTSHSTLEHQIFDAEESGFDPTRCTWLETQTTTPSPLPVAARDGRVRPDGAEVTFVEDLPERATIRVKTTDPGMLILADQYYPGWNASIDNKDCPIYRANAFTRAVYIPKGEHSVRFSYQPLSLIAGLCLALVGCCWLFFLRLAQRPIKQ